MLRRIPRVVCGLVLITVSLLGGALLLLTPLQDVPAILVGRQLFVTGVTRNAQPGDTIIELTDHSFSNPVFASATTDRWTGCDLVILQATKDTTETGRTVLQAQRTWTLPLEMTQLPAFTGVARPLLLPKGAKWFACAAGVSLTLVSLSRRVVSVLRFATLAVLGLSAGTMFSVSLQKIGLASADAIIGVIMSTMVVNLLPARFRKDGGRAQPCPDTSR